MSLLPTICKESEEKRAAKEKTGFLPSLLEVFPLPHEKSMITGAAHGEMEQLLIKTPSFHEATEHQYPYQSTINSIRVRQSTLASQSQNAIYAANYHQISDQSCISNNLHQNESTFHNCRTPPYVAHSSAEDNPWETEYDRYHSRNKPDYHVTHLCQEQPISPPALALSGWQSDFSQCLPFSPTHQHPEQLDSIMNCSPLSTSFPEYYARRPMNSISMPENQVQMPMPSISMPEYQRQLPMTSISLPENQIQMPMTSISMPGNQVKMLMPSISMPENQVKMLMPSISMPENQVKMLMPSISMPENQVKMLMPSISMPENQIQMPMPPISMPEYQRQMPKPTSLPEYQRQMPMTSISLPENQIQMPMPSISMPENQIQMPIPSISMPDNQVQMPSISLPNYEVQKLTPAQMHMPSNSSSHYQIQMSTSAQMPKPSVSLSDHHVQITRPSISYHLHPSQPQYPLSNAEISTISMYPEYPVRNSKFSILPPREVEQATHCLKFPEYLNQCPQEELSISNVSYQSLPLAQTPDHKFQVELEQRPASVASCYRMISKQADTYSDSENQHSTSENMVGIKIDKISPKTELLEIELAKITPIEGKKRKLG